MRSEYSLTNPIECVAFLFTRHAFQEVSLLGPWGRNRIVASASSATARPRHQMIYAGSDQCVAIGLLVEIRYWSRKGMLNC